MRMRSPARSSRRAIAAVEMALISPLLISLMVGVWEVGRLTWVQKIVDNAAREGGRQGSTGLKSVPQVQQDVINYLNNAGIPTAHVTVTVRDNTNPTPALPGPWGSDPLQGASYLDQLQVDVTLPFNDVRWVALNFFTPNNLQIHSTKYWVSMVNVPLTVPTSLPSQPQ